MDPYDILLYPIITEKAVAKIDLENKLCFAVKRDATKKEIKEAFEKLYSAKVEKVSTYIDPKGKKRAYLKLKKGFNARDIATKLGLL